MNPNANENDQDRPFASSDDDMKSSFIQKNKKLMMGGAGAVAVLIAGYILSDVSFSSAPKLSAEELKQQTEQAIERDMTAKALEQAKAMQTQAQAEQAMPGASDAQAASPNPAQAASMPSKMPVARTDPKDERIAVLEEDVQALRLEIEELKKSHAARQKQQAKRPVVIEGSSRSQSAAQNNLPHLATLGSGAYINATPDKITLLSGGREIEVRAGQRFPNGSTYIGFDRNTEVVKTDRGDYRIN